MLKENSYKVSQNLRPVVPSFTVYKRIESLKWKDHLTKILEIIPVMRDVVSERRLFFTGKGLVFPYL